MTTDVAGHLGIAPAEGRGRRGERREERVGAGRGGERGGIGKVIGYETNARRVGERIRLTNGSFGNVCEVGKERQKRIRVLEVEQQATF